MAEIKCTVDSCKHNNAKECALHSITVGNAAAGDARTKKETECDSFMS